MLDFFGICATALNIFGNGYLLIKLCSKSSQSVPAGLIFIQSVANFMWIVHSCLNLDYCLLTTSLSSLIMQITSLFLLRRNKRISEATQIIE